MAHAHPPDAPSRCAHSSHAAIQTPPHDHPSRSQSYPPPILSPAAPQTAARSAYPAHKAHTYTAPDPNTYFRKSSDPKADPDYPNPATQSHRPAHMDDASPASMKTQKTAASAPYPCR